MPTPTHAQTLPPPHVPGLVTREHPPRRATKCAAPHTTSDVECGLQVGHPGAHLARVDRLRRELDAPLVWTASAREWVLPIVWPSDTHRSGFTMKDYTCGRWPDAICNDRRTWTTSDGVVTRNTVCTRRPGHSGRHAHGDQGQVWAVWEKRPSTQLAAMPAATKGWAAVPEDLRIRVPEAPSHQVARVARLLGEVRSLGGEPYDFHAVLDEARRLVVLGLRAPESL